MDIFYCKQEENLEYSIIGLLKNSITNDSSQLYWDWLESMNDFKKGQTDFGEVPREQKFYDEKMRYFSPTWRDQTLERWMPHTYDKMLQNMQMFLQNEIQTLDIFNKKGVVKPVFNSCLINKYKNENSSIRPHRDSQDTFGKNPTVVGVSLGDERTICFKRIKYDPKNMRSIKLDKDNPEEVNILLPHGSVMIMAGAVQKYFSHEIPKCKKKSTKKTTRYSLTFREYI